MSSNTIDYDKLFEDLDNGLMNDNDTKTVGDIKIEYSRLGFIISDTRYTN